MMYSAYKLNKQGDNIQPWRTPFPIWNKSVVPCPVLTIASWPAFRFLRRQVRWSSIPISLRNFQFVVIHTVKGFGVINEAEVVFLEFFCFFYDLLDHRYSCLGSTLAWKIPWTEEPGRLQSMGSHRVARLSDFAFTFHFHALEKEMATHSSVLAWRIPGTRSLVGCHLWGRTGSDTTEAT